MHGTVVSLPQSGPDYISFLFEPTTRQAELARLPNLIRVRWYRHEFRPATGEDWHLKLRLRPPRGLVNFQGRDSELIYFSSGIGAAGTVLEARNYPTFVKSDFVLNQVRAGLRDRFREILVPGSARALLLSLAIADRSELSRSDWRLLRTTGTGHLLAISGLHIGLAAVIGFWLFRSASFVIPFPATGGSSGLIFCSVGAALFAIAYGALAGFPVSTVRALVMLGAAMLVLLNRLSPGFLQAWTAAVAIVLLLNPFSFFTAGFWLSFCAVLALIAYFSPRCATDKWWTSLPRAQLAVMTLTLPLCAFWFQSGSWLAIPGNLLSIPWVSFVSVPLTLAAMVSLSMPWLFEHLSELALRSCDALLIWLAFLSELGDDNAVLTPDVGLTGVILGVGGGMLLLLPRGLTARWLGLCILAAVFLPRAPTLDEGEYSVETLDVGQGLSVLVRTRNHLLLYDTGPGDGDEWSMVESVIAPAIGAHGGGGPDLIVVSHADLDHAGGLEDTLSRFEDADLIFNQPTDQGELNECHAGRSWSWDAVDFEVLHPSKWLPYLGNDSSCVISIDNGIHKTLLTGDIGSAVESRLAPDLGQYEFITVPHHGSTSSSSDSFLEAVNPALASVSAAYDNRFGFPRTEVVRGYQRVDSGLLSTIDCGAVRVRFTADRDPLVEAARIQRSAPWRWQPDTADCMVTNDRAMYHLNRPKNKE